MTNGDLPNLEIKLPKLKPGTIRGGLARGTGDEADQALLAGDKAFDQDDLPAAKRHYARARKLSPRDPAPRVGLVRVRLAQTEIPTSFAAAPKHPELGALLRELDEIIRLDRSYGPAHLERGRVALVLGKAGAALASLEGAAWGLAYASGLAGTQNISYLLAPGDHIILTDDAYGGTHRFVAKVISRYGIDYTLVDMSDLEQIRSAIRPETRLIWAETPTNPYLKIVDIRGVHFARRREAFGQRIADFPLVRRQVAQIKAEWLAALHSTWHLTSLDDAVDLGNAPEADAAFHRYLVNANKLACSLAATQTVREAIEILGGALYGVTTGAPVALRIENKDWANWRERWAAGDVPSISVPRPGHADYPGMVKYGLDDARPVSERASARETAARVAVGALARQLLDALDGAGAAVLRRQMVLGPAPEYAILADAEPALPWPVRTTAPQPTAR